MADKLKTIQERLNSGGKGGPGEQGKMVSTTKIYSGDAAKQFGGGGNVAFKVKSGEGAGSATPILSKRTYKSGESSVQTSGTSASSGKESDWEQTIPGKQKWKAGKSPFGKKKKKKNVGAQNQADAIEGS